MPNLMKKNSEEDSSPYKYTTTKDKVVKYTYLYYLYLIHYNCIFV